MTVKDIVREWLVAHDYDGLMSDDGECGCKLDDLAPCSDGGWAASRCEPGYLTTCNEECGCGSFHITTTIPSTSSSGGVTCTEA